MTAMRLTPGVIVEVNDVVSGGRKLGLTDETGLGFFDLHESGALPKVLHAELNPVEMGSIASWLVRLPDERCMQLTDAWKHMADNNVDQLTIARALRWAIENDSTDVELMLKMGFAMSDQVKKGHQVIEDAMRT